MDSDYEDPTLSDVYVQVLPHRQDDSRLQPGLKIIGDRRIAILDNIAGDLTNFLTLREFLESLSVTSRTEMLLTLREYADEKLNS